MVFFSFFLMSWRSHWPMQGPQALARTTPPNSRRVDAFTTIKNGFVLQHTHNTNAYFKQITCEQKFNRKTHGVHNTRTENNATEQTSYITYNSIPLDCGSDLLWSRCNVEKWLALDTVTQRLFDDGSAPAHILVRAVGARPDEAYLYLQRPVVLLRSFTYLNKGKKGIKTSITISLFYFSYKFI